MPYRMERQRRCETSALKDIDAQYWSDRSRPAGHASGVVEEYGTHDDRVVRAPIAWRQTVTRGCVVWVAAVAACVQRVVAIHFHGGVRARGEEGARTACHRARWATSVSHPRRWSLLSCVGGRTSVRRLPLAARISWTTPSCDIPQLAKVALPLGHSRRAPRSSGLLSCHVDLCSCSSLFFSLSGSLPTHRPSCFSSLLPRSPAHRWRLRAAGVLAGSRAATPHRSMYSRGPLDSAPMPIGYVFVCANWGSPDRDPGFVAGSRGCHEPCSGACALSGLTPV